SGSYRRMPHIEPPTSSARRGRLSARRQASHEFWHIHSCPKSLLFCSTHPLLRMGRGSWTRGWTSATSRKDGKRACPSPQSLSSKRHWTLQSARLSTRSLWHP